MTSSEQADELIVEFVRRRFGSLLAEDVRQVLLHDSGMGFVDGIRRDLQRKMRVTDGSQSGGQSMGVREPAGAQ